jgi:hypothetical protein
VTAIVECSQEHFPVAGITLPDTWTSASQYPYAPAGSKKMLHQCCRVLF